MATVNSAEKTAEALRAAVDALPDESTAAMDAFFSERGIDPDALYGWARRMLAANPTTRLDGPSMLVGVAVGFELGRMSADPVTGLDPVEEPPRWVPTDDLRGDRDR